MDNHFGVSFWEPPRLSSGAVAEERTLDERSIAADPLDQLIAWLTEAAEAGELLPNAMALATCSASGTPALRMVLLDRVDERGCLFQTNLDSPKAHQLGENPQAALVFFWPRMLRQVRIVGPVEQVPRDEIERYFAASPVGIQAMLRACRQGQTISSRAELEARYAEVLNEADAGAALAMPPDWGGFRVELHMVEFWQGRHNRLQDRLRFTRGADSQWSLVRLMP